MPTINSNAGNTVPLTLHPQSLSSSFINKNDIVENNLRDLESLLHSLEGKRTEINQLVEEVKSLKRQKTASQIVAGKTSLNQLKGEIEGIEKDITMLKGALATNEKLTVGYISKMNALQGKFQDKDRAIDNSTSRIDRIVNNNSALENQLREQVAKAQSKAGTLQAEMSVYERTITHTHSEVDSLEKSLHQSLSALVRQIDDLSMTRFTDFAPFLARPSDRDITLLSNYIATILTYDEFKKIKSADIPIGVAGAVLMMMLAVASSGNLQERMGKLDPTSQQMLLLAFSLIGGFLVGVGINGHFRGNPKYRAVQNIEVERRMPDKKKNTQEGKTANIGPIKINLKTLAMGATKTSVIRASLTPPRSCRYGAHFHENSGR